MNSTTVAAHARPLDVLPVAIDRIAPEARPAEPVVGWQRWHSTLFVHWDLPIEALRPHVPKRLGIDTYDGRAWLTAALFTITGARLRPLPQLPGLSSFHEVNLRTYVHLDGKAPGLWYFSMDATNLVACALARIALRLPYFPARAKREQIGDTHRYMCHRVGSRTADITAEWRAKSAVIDAPNGSLEHFLTQRFFIYSPSAAGRLWREQVHHAKWQLTPVDDLAVEQTLDDAHHLPLLSKRPVAQYSPGVDVEFFPPHLV